MVVTVYMEKSTGVKEKQTHYNRTQNLLKINFRYDFKNKPKYMFKYAKNVQLATCQVF